MSFTINNPICPQGTPVEECVRRMDALKASVKPQDEVKEPNGSEMFFGTAEQRPVQMTVSAVGILFCTFMAWYFYGKGRTFWMWLFGALAALNLTSFIITAFGLHLQNKNK